MEDQPVPIDEYAEPRFIVNGSDARVLVLGDDRGSAVGGTVVADDEFEVAVGLGEDRVNRLGNIRARRCTREYIPKPAAAPALGSGETGLSWLA